MTEERITQFDKGTPEAVQRILEELRQNSSRPRVRLFLGDPETGKDWNEENDVTGMIGRSTGDHPILILVNNRRSLGGPAILTAHVVKIVNIGTGETLYQHPTYHTARFFAVEGSDLPEYSATVYTQEMSSPAPVAEVYARCKSYASAYRLAAYMEGKRHNK